MLTIEMKINGTLIGQVYAHNISDTFGMSEYEYHCYVMDLTGKPSLVEGHVSHQRQEGFTKLAEIIYGDINANF